MSAPRKTMRRREFPGQGRYLTFSCYRRLPLFGNDRIKSAFRGAIADLRSRGAFELYAWVIMPEHVHMLILPAHPHWPVDRIMHRLKRPFAARVLQRWRELNAAALERIVDARGRTHFWQAGGGYDRNIVSDDHVINKIQYIHENPVRRGLAESPCDWPWSSARWYDGQRRDGIEIDPLWETIREVRVDNRGDELA